MTRTVLDGGTVLKGRYVIDELMGAGGFANAYRAWDPLLDCIVAIKEYLQNVPEFLEEARMTARFRSCPNIVYVYDFFEENGAAYIVMELLQGQTLMQRLKSGGRIPRREAIAITRSVLAALETVHRCGIVHRDVAPDNVFLLSDGKVKLFDFGCAGVIGTARKEIIIKQGYSPPEQYRTGSFPSPAEDVYAAAAMLVQMLSGRKPQSAGERLQKDRMGTMVRRCTKGQRKLRRVLRDALRLDADKRTNSAAVFSARLADAQKASSAVLWPVLFLFGILVVIMAVYRERNTAPKVNTELQTEELTETTEGMETAAAETSKQETEETTEKATEKTEEQETEVPSEENTTEVTENPTGETAEDTEMLTERNETERILPETVSGDRKRVTAPPAVSQTEPTVPDPSGW